MIWLYDGSWDGLLSAVFQAYNDQSADIQSHESFSGCSMFPVRTVETSPIQVDRLRRGMERLSPQLPVTAYRAFLSEQPGRENALLNTLRIGFAHNRDPLPLLQEPPIQLLCGLAGRVSNEERLFLGIIRFSRASKDLYCADIEPDYCILPLMGRHFHMRFNDQHLIIRDLKRRLALLSTPQEWWMANLLDETQAPLPKDDEMSALWRAYFQAIANPARKNPKLQQRFVPLKYRTHITEFQMDPPK